MIKDYYQILNLNNSTSLKPIQRLYRAYLQNYRENRKQTDSLEFIDKIEAFYVLKNPKTKALYSKIHHRVFEEKKELAPKYNKLMASLSFRGQELGKHFLEADDKELRRHSESTRVQSFLNCLGELFFSLWIP